MFEIPKSCWKLKQTDVWAILLGDNILRSPSEKFIHLFQISADFRCSFLVVVILSQLLTEFTIMLMHDPLDNVNQE